MKKILNRVFLVGFFGLMVLKANATFFFPIGPILDYMNLAKAQLQTMADQSLFVEKMEKAYEMLEEMGVLKSEEVDSGNNAWLNKNVREAQRVQEISKLEQMAASVPAFMTCFTIKNTILLKNSYKNQSSYIENSKKNLDSLSMVSDTSDKSKVTVTDKLLEHLDKTIEKNQDKFSDKKTKTVKKSSDTDKPYIANVSALFSSDEKNDTLNADQQEAMEGFVLLIAPPYQSTSYERKKEEIDKSLILKRARKEIRHNMANQTFQKILAKRISGNGKFPSELALLNENDKNLYFNPDSVKESIAYKIQVSQVASLTSLTRNSAIIMASRVHYSVLEFRENLEIEKIIADRLLNKINK
jgi:hypothetical protein